MHTDTQQLTGSRWGMGRRSCGWILGVLLGLLGGWQPCQAADFTCPAGASGVACLIDAINEANANGEENIITWAAGTYTLTTVNNNTGEPTGLPPITGTLTITGAGADTTIIERDPSAPEAFRLLRVAETGTLTLKGLTLRGGDAPGGFDGGGISNFGILTLTNCSLTHNTADSNGGGILNNGILTLTNCSLTHNTADHQFGGGGGIRNTNGTLTLTNCSLTHNTARPDGGGLASGGGILTLTNSTLAHNTAAVAGGGLHNAQNSSTTLQNTILALNRVTNTPFASGDCAAVENTLDSLGNNLIGDPTQCNITLQASDLRGNPGLDTFTDDGTPGNGHFPLLQTSQAIDAGNDVACPPTDQLGQPRVDQCDIGAIEFQLSDTTPPVVTIVSVIPDTLWPPNGRTVSVTIVATITDAGSGVDPSTTAYAVEDEYGSVEPSGSLTLGQDGRYTATIGLEASRQ